MSAPSEWIEWAGGECPVPGDTLVNTQLRYEMNIPLDEIAAQKPDPAGQWYWQHKGYTADIIAYRVVQS